jgi:hypothetical protein
MTSISLRTALSIVVLLYGIWRYRKNRIVALGAITLGVAGLAFALSNVQGFPDWLVGVLVLVFLILSVIVLLLPVLYLVKWLIAKLNRRGGAVGAKAPTP